MMFESNSTMLCENFSSRDVILLIKILYNGIGFDVQSWQEYRWFHGLKYYIMVLGLMYKISPHIFMRLS